MAMTTSSWSCPLKRLRPLLATCKNSDSNINSNKTMTIRSCHRLCHHHRPHPHSRRPNLMACEVDGARLLCPIRGLGGSVDHFRPLALGFPLFHISRKP
mmetsp:Transcript_54620/g.116722  ORF Transcript_54620/g.116722 Transcript_54620/m.116722 type:complete len:99 (+) Transcript_54620:1532-1828(+)